MEEHFKVHCIVTVYCSECRAKLNKLNKISGSKPWW